MLTIQNKEKILRRVGVAVPACPRAEGSNPWSPQDPDAGIWLRGDVSGTEAVQWARTIETLFVQYGAERAAKSLRDAEQARQADVLRRAQSRWLR